MNKTKTSSQKKMTFLSIYFLGINAIVGSGAFLLPQEIYKHAGVSSILVLICAALTVSMVALCYADLSSRFSGSGAAWLYSYNAFGKFTGFQVGLFSWLLGCLTLSAEVVALERTIKNIIPFFRNNIVDIIFPILIIIIFLVINLYGSKIVDIVNNVSSGFKIATILFFIILGIFFINKANLKPFTPNNMRTPQGFLHNFGSAFSVVFYMFTGFSFIPVAAAQMKNPEKNIPKALITVMISVTILYVLVQSIVIGILGPDIVHYDIPVATAMYNKLGYWAYALIVIGMLVSIAGVAFAVSFSTPALAASLASEHKLLPSFLGKVNKDGAPFYSILATGIISIIFTRFSYIFLVACIVLASFVQYVPSIFAVIKLKHTKEFPNHGFSLKGDYIIPIIALIASAYLLTSVDTQVLLLLTGIFVLGCVIYFTSIKNKA